MTDDQHSQQTAEPAAGAAPAAPVSAPSEAAPPAATTSRRNWIVVAAIAGFVLVLCCVAGAIGGLAWLNRDTPERVVEEYLSAVQQDDRPRAEGLLCDGLRRGAAGRLTGLAQDWMEVVDFEVTNTREGERSAEVTARITFKISGVAATNTFRFTVIKEEDDWLICGFQAPGVNLDQGQTR